MATGIAITTRTTTADRDGDCDNDKDSDDFDDREGRIGSFDARHVASTDA
jgi:hypothetical protein